MSGRVLPDARRNSRSTGMHRRKPFFRLLRRSSPMRKLTKRAAIIGTAVVVTIGGAGVAFAAWTATGTGAASATAGTAGHVDVTSATASDALVPGGSSALVLHVHNSNPYPVVVTDL